MFSFEGANLQIVGVDGGEGTPVPIPNSEVKLTCADNTWLATAREDKKMPTQNKTPSEISEGVFVFPEIYLNPVASRRAGPWSRRTIPHNLMAGIIRAL